MESRAGGSRETQGAGGHLPGTAGSRLNGIWRSPWYQNSPANCQCMGGRPHTTVFFYNTLPPCLPPHVRVNVVLYPREFFLAQSWTCLHFLM